jgi:disulfide bond formation protein DsbB
MQLPEQDRMLALRRITTQPIEAAALAIAAIGAAAILGAYFFEYVVKLAPCPLCLEQRVPYYLAIPLALVVLVAAVAKAPRWVLLTGLAVIAAAMLWNAGLGTYHAGIEWKWWAGPQGCAGPLSDLGAGGNLLQQLENINVVRCDEAAWRFLGLSLAGWNVLISLGLAGVALWAMRRSARRAAAYGSSSVSQ